MIVYCAVCNKELNRPPSRIAKAKDQVCDKECHRKLMESRAARVPCVVCGKEVKRTPAHQSRNEMGICCSRKCFGKLQTGSNNPAFSTGYKLKVKVPCEICGKELTRTKGQLSKSKHQSCWECRSELYKRYPPKTAPTVTKTCPVCGKEFSGPPAMMKARTTCSRSCGAKLHSKRISGEGNGRYVHGNCLERYPLEFRHVADLVRERDSHACRICGLPQEEHPVALHVHHIDYVKTNNDMNNLITLCQWCHGVMHGSLEERAIFSRMLSKRLPQLILSPMFTT